MAKMSSQERKLWQRCFWSGILTLILGAIVLAVYPATGGPYATGYGSPIIALEFAGTVSEAQSVINYGQAEWPEFKDAMYRGTILDMPFACLYGFFIFCFLRAAKHQTSLSIYFIFALIGILAGLFDIIENLNIFSFLADPDMPDNGSEKRMTPLLASLKFLALALSGLGASMFLLRQPRILRKAEGLFAALGVALVFIGLSDPSQFGNFLGFGVIMIWFAMLAYAATQSSKTLTN